MAWGPGLSTLGVNSASETGSSGAAPSVLSAGAAGPQGVGASAVLPGRHQRGDPMAASAFSPGSGVSLGFWKFLGSPVLDHHQRLLPPRSRPALGLHLGVQHQGVRSGAPLTRFPSPCRFRFRVALRRAEAQRGRQQHGLPLSVGWIGEAGQSREEGQRAGPWLLEEKLLPWVASARGLGPWEFSLPVWWFLSSYE